MIFFKQNAEFEFEESFIEIKGKDVSLPTLISYIFDWLIYTAVLIVAIIYGRFSRPMATDFDVHDSSIMHMYVPELATFAPIWVLLLLGVVVPILFVVIICMFTTKLPLCRKLWDIQSCLLAMLGAVSCELLVVCLVKNFTAKPRPDFLSRCVPLSFTSQTMGTLSTISVCMNPFMYNVYEGLRSFPSGHAATIFSTSTVQAWFSVAKLNVFDGRGIACKAIISIVYPLGMASIVSFSRVSDNKHFIMDVVAGSFIGLFTGSIFYLIYFPFPLKLDNLGRSYLPRRFGVGDIFNGVGGFWKIDDLDGGYVERTEVPGYYETSNAENNEADKKEGVDPVKLSNENQSTNRNVEPFPSLASMSTSHQVKIGSKRVPRPSNTEGSKQQTLNERSVK
ncbi:hypothetical protein CANARDRAFT_28326 [[Candida] arabinofermentans NRRL YB-2248]|uniref:Phosphatidic acid phosphatase type 2/haloperoxidase domain-containing protein n=1 Tax=[Candida] arabinofermentans NRRL YB-2248 TaxID=983967 RepID=A0A1E4T1E0_9ASCO|nr:hypothetical protein CANARDRAFT_28326 [[Candida] arabinofermentans NRRL YB-2248]